MDKESNKTEKYLKKDGFGGKGFTFAWRYSTSSKSNDTGWLIWAEFLVAAFIFFNASRYYALRKKIVYD